MEKIGDREAWDNISKMYSKLIIPNRPSLDDIKNYGRAASLLLKNKKNPKIMIMGSTPELRSIMHKFRLLSGANIFCVDISKDMYKAMSYFCITNNSQNEVHLRRSWLETGFENNYFDLILGDEVICNVPFELQGKLFEEIIRIMKNDGAWVTRHNFSIEKNKKQSLGEIMENLAVDIYKGNINFDLAVNLLFVDFFYYNGWHNPTNNSMTSHLRDMKKEYAAHFRMHPLRKIIKELIDLYDAFWVSLSGDHKWTIVSKAESRKELEKFFAIKKELYAKDYPTAKNSPIYLLKKK